MQEQEQEPTPLTSMVSSLATPSAVIPVPSSSKAGKSALPGDEDSDEEDEERIDMAALKALSKQIQRAPHTPSSSAPRKIHIPRRGEKDFEPLTSTQLIQEKMLREGREGFLEGLEGVRGGGSKNISHAILDLSDSAHSSSSTTTIYPRILINRGSLLTTMGQTFTYRIDEDSQISLPASTDLPSSSSPSPPSTDKPKEKGKQKQITDIELLPEEALYLLERGSLQIWIKKPDLSNVIDQLESAQPMSGTQLGRREFEVNEAEGGVEGCVEMSVMEAFDTFLGVEGMTLERYQAYASLKRLGYTVHRTKEFLPERFRLRKGQGGPAIPQSSSISISSAFSTVGRTAFSTFQLIINTIRRVVHGVLGTVWNGIIGRLEGMFGGIVRLGMRISDGGKRTSGRAPKGTLLSGWDGVNYGSLYQRLRIIPRHQSLTPSASTTMSSDGSSKQQSAEQQPMDIYAPLHLNPYLPFFHIWRPSTHWTRSKWNKGEGTTLAASPSSGSSSPMDSGLALQGEMKPAFSIAVVDARTDRVPSWKVMEEVFEGLEELEPPRYRPRVGVPAKTGGAGVGETKIQDKTAWKTAWNRFVSWIPSFLQSEAKKTDQLNPPLPQINTFAALKQGDKTLVIAVNDGGNIGWMRFGRGTFGDEGMGMVGLE